MSRAAVGVLATNERWLPDLAVELRLSPHTLHGWRRKGWLHARQVGGRGGAWAVWTSPGELKRLRALQGCPRVWSNRETLKRLRPPQPRR